MKALICKNTQLKSYSNFKFWLFWQQLATLAKMQFFQILLPESQWRIPASQFVYISHTAQTALTNSLDLKFTVIMLFLVPICYIKSFMEYNEGNLLLI